MKIFIPRVPSTISKNDLRKFSAKLLEQKMHIPFTAQPGILSCEILQIKDVQLGITEHHGLVSIQPSSAGQWFIQHLRSQRLHNKLMLGREYFARTGGVKAQFSEGDRRRKHLQIEKVGQINVQAKGMEQFVQTYLS